MTLRDKKVLLVEDDIVIRATVISVLTKLNCTVCETTASVRETLDFLKDEKFDLIILDIVLPEGTGFDILDYVSENELSLSVLVYSSISDMERNKILSKYLISKNLSLSILQKDAEKIKLIESIHELIERHNCLMLKNKELPELQQTLIRQRSEIEYLKKQQDSLPETIKETIIQMIKDHKKTIALAVIGVIASVWGYVKDFVRTFIN